MNQQTVKPPQQLVAWILWGAIMVGLIVIQFVISGGVPSGEQTEDPSMVFVLLCMAGVFAGTLVRWVMIPRLQTIGKQLPAMIVGLALCEASGLLQMFLLSGFPDTQKLIFFLALLGIAQFAPTYMKEG